MMANAPGVLRSLLVTANRSSLFWPLLRSRVAIFMLHRFDMPDLGVVGHDPALLRRALASLRRDGCELVSLAAAIERGMEGHGTSRPLVAFTIDDGYIDHAAVAAPVFAEFDCPVTTFVTTGFLDRALWFWWDRIEHVFTHTTQSAVTVDTGGGVTSLAWTDDIARRIAQRAFTEWCKTLPDAAKLVAIERLAAAAEVELPLEPPSRYAPMSWDDLRACERLTMNFGPHTVTHPVLSRTSDAQSRFELTEAWRRLHCEAASPVPVMCYPNGQAEDFSERETRVLAALGFIGAVTGISGYARPARNGRDARDPFRIRRFAYPDAPDDLSLIAGGVERFKEIVRRQP